MYSEGELVTGQLDLFERQLASFLYPPNVALPVTPEICPS